MAKVAERFSEMESDKSGGKTDLQELIDTKYEQYLDLLDQFQKAQQALKEQLASGFMSIAAANFSSQARIRYGQDFYDQRMKASRRLSIKETAQGARVSIVKEVSPDLTKTEETSPNADEVVPTSNDSKKVPTDPIRWFGLFVPASLRAAQDSFSNVVDDSIPGLVNLDKALKEVEIEIRRARKHLLKQSKDH